MDIFFQDAIRLVIAAILTELQIFSNSQKLQYDGIIRNRRTRNSQNERKHKADDITESQLPDPFLNIIKLQNDLLYLNDILSNTLAELRDTGKFRTILFVIEKRNKEMEEEKNLIEQHKTNMSDLKACELDLANFKSKADAMLLEKSEMLHNLKNQCQIIRKLNELENKLVRKWEETRYTQATIVAKRDEEMLEKNISDHVQRVFIENRALYDIKKYINEECEIYKELIEGWKIRYSKEMNELMKQISERQRQIKELHTVQEKHFEIHRNRQKFIEEYLEQQAERIRFLELEEKRSECAIRIQAWWRGVMVRRCLGPYRKKLKKGKKAKKEK